MNPYKLTTAQLLKIRAKLRNASIKADLKGDDHLFSLIAKDLILIDKVLGFRGYRY